MKIIKHRKMEKLVSYSLNFPIIQTPGAGFAFDCDALGVVDEEKLKQEKPCAWENLQLCKAGGMHRMLDVQYHDWDAQFPIYCTGRWEFVKIGSSHVQKYESYYTQPAVGICNHCEQEVLLSGFTNTCDCGVDYNSAGQELAPREQWGSETGESLSEILSIH